MNEKSHKILIVDDHAVLREGLAMLINSQPDMEICCQASDATGAFEALTTKTHEMAIIDISLNGINGIELTKQIISTYPQIKVLILSMHEENIFAERALHAGARGYIMKSEEASEILTAIREVLNDKIYLSENMKNEIMQNLFVGSNSSEDERLRQLSDRELEVLMKIATGLTNKQVANELSLSVKTVETHKENIKKKLRLANITELQRFANEWYQKARR